MAVESLLWDIIRAPLLLSTYWLASNPPLLIFCMLIGAVELKNPSLALCIRPV